MSKSENSTITDSSTKTLTNTTDTAKTINTLKTTMNDVPVELELSNIQTNIINKFHIQILKLQMKTFINAIRT